MSDTKFTKGEWLGFKDGRWQSDDINDYTLEGGNNPSWVDIVCNGQAVAIVPNHGDTLDDNAHLIAAAPEMYKFLDDLANGRGADYPIEKLLAKARGEQ